MTGQSPERALDGTDRAPTVLIAGHFGAGNTGDESILAAVSEQLCRRVPGLTISVVSDRPADTLADHGLHTVHWRALDNLADAVGTADVVLLAAGGLANDLWGFDPDNVLTWKHHGAERVAGVAFLAALAGRPVAMLGMGVGPLSEEVSRRWVAAAFSQAAYASLRDASSREPLVAAGLPADAAVVGADPAILLEPSDAQIVSERLAPAGLDSAQGPVVAVALRSWDVGVDEDAWLTAVAAGLDAFVSRRQATVLFVPFQRRQRHLCDDPAAAHAVVARMRETRRVVVCEGVASPHETAGLIAGADLAVGMRLHALWFAALGRTPAVALVYDPKVAAAAEILGYEASGLSVDGTGLADLLDRAWSGRERQRERLEWTVKDLRTRATADLDAVAGLLRSPPDAAPAPPVNALLPSLALAQSRQIASLRREHGKVSRLQVEQDRWRAALEAARQETATWKYRSDYARWQLTALRRRRWWRLGELLGGIRARPLRLLRLSADLGSLRRPADPTPPPRPPEARRGAGDDQAGRGEGEDQARRGAGKVRPRSADQPVAGRGARAPSSVGEPVPAVSHEEPVPRRPQTRAVTIASAERVRRLACEWSVQPLEVSSWHARIGAPALLLVDSTGLADPSWTGGDGAALSSLLAWCGRQQIPSVLWDVEPSGAPRPERWAPQFTRVFAACSDRVEALRQLREDQECEWLPPAAQPRLHRPHANRDRRAGTGWLLPATSSEVVRAHVEAAAEPGLTVYRPTSNATALAWLERARIRPVPPEPVSALSAHAVFLSAGSRLQEVIDLLGTGTPVVGPAEPALDELLGQGVITATANADETRRWLWVLTRDDELRDRVAIRGLRAVLAAHTYRHRSEAVLASLGIGTTASPPMVSMVCVTNRPSQLETVSANAAWQTYAPLELVLVLHAFQGDPDSVREQLLTAGVGAVTVVTMSERHTLGACLNAGVAAATGEFVTKVDDDNFYAPAFVSDLVQGFSYADAEIVGKRSHYAYLEGQGCLVLRYPGSEYSFVDSVSGSAVMVRRSLTDQVPFPEVSVGEDTIFLREARLAGARLYSTDRFNYVYVRAADLGRHTWKVSDAELLAKSRVQVYGRNFDHVVV